MLGGGGTAIFIFFLLLSLVVDSLVYWPDSINNFVGVLLKSRAHTRKRNGWGSGVGGV